MTIYHTIKEFIVRKCQTKGLNSILTLVTKRPSEHLLFWLLHIVLRFVGPADNIKSCGFIQMMEQRLENVFAEAQEKVEDSYGTLSVEVVFSIELENKV